MKLTGSQILLKMLELYDVKHIFGLPGETTISLYKYWMNCPQIKHVLVHDERSAAYMADAYAKVTGKVGVCEAPSPGAAHPAPGVLESQTSSIPTICLTSDVPFNADKRNMLSGFDQNKLYDAITKESLLVTRASDIPYIIRRAFRVALSDRPGAVHIRIPMDVHKEVADVNDLYADPRGSMWPSSRPTADKGSILEAVKLLSHALRPVIVCGQGALVSGAGEAVTKLAERLNIPVGCTMTAKGTISEVHPLSIRLIGARGGTSYSNEFIKRADLVFFIGSNTDSAGTDSWQLPDRSNSPKIIHLDISGVEAGNNYPTTVSLVGDAKRTLESMLGKIDELNVRGKYQNARSDVLQAMSNLDLSLKKTLQTESSPVHPVRFMKELEKQLPQESYIVVEPSIGSIFSAAYLVQKIAGRKFLSNYSQGALGYMIPASIAVSVAKPDAIIIGIGGDGSFHFSCGELETLARLGANVKYIICKNNVFGWIKGEMSHVYHSKYFATDFTAVDYTRVAEGFGIRGFKIEDSRKINAVLKDAFSYRGPALIELSVPDESVLVPPVPRWIDNAKNLGLEYCY